MARQLYTTNQMALWFNNEIWMDTNSTAIWRIVWGKWDRPDRIIIYYDMYEGNKVLDLLSRESYDLYLYHKKAGPLDVLNGSKQIYKFEDCKINRRWIPEPMSLSPDYRIVQGFVELTCKIIEGDNG